MKKYNSTTDTYEDYIEDPKKSKEKKSLKELDKLNVPYEHTKDGIFIEDEYLTQGEQAKIEANK